MTTRKRKESRTEEVHEYGILEDTRELFLFGDINEESASALLRNLRILESINKEPITIYCSTKGGEVYAAFGIYDAITSCGSRVAIVGCSEVMSAGTLILQAADDRLCFANTSFLLHDGTTSISEQDHKNMVITAKWEDRLRKKLQLVLTERIVEKTQQEVEKVKRLLKAKMQADWYLTAEEALNLGIIDKIL